MLIDYQIIGAEYFAGIDPIAIEQIVVSGSYNWELVNSTKEWSAALKNYLILMHNPGLIKNLQIGEAQLLFNRYYWFKRFYWLYSLENGKDAGMEQQVTMLIEMIGNKVKDFNWNELQRIDASIENKS